MPTDPAEAVALFRYSLIAEAANPAISAAERGLIVRGLASFAHQHPDGTTRTYSRGTLDRWVRAYRARGLAGLRPMPRSDVGAVRRHPELLAEAAAPRAELPVRSSGAIADMLEENTRAGQDVLREAIARRGLPQVLYADNGAPFANAALERSCAVLGIRLVTAGPTPRLAGASRKD